MNNGRQIGRALRIAALLGVCGAASAPPIEVIFSEIPGDPSSLAPDVNIPFTGFLTLYASPDGSHWIFKGFIDDVENDVIVTGSGTTGATVAREADPTSIPGSTHSFLDSDCGVNNAGMYAYGSRLDGVGSDADEVIFLWDGAAEVAAAREGELADGLIDPLGAGDETFGNSLNSTHVLDDGRAAFRADLINNIDSDFESALYHGIVPVAQENVMLVGGTPDSFTALSGNTFSSDLDGTQWIVEADVDPSFSTREAVVVTGEVELEDGQVITELGAPIDGVFAVDIAGNGDWFARGDDTADNDWAVRNGLTIAYSGADVTPLLLSGEHWTDEIFLATGDSLDNILVGGETDNSDPNANEVIVLNNTAVVIREGDPVDLNGNGMEDDDVFIDSFSPNDAFLDEDLNLYAFVSLRDSAGADLGDAFIRQSVAPACLADLDEDGSIGSGDLAILLGSWGPGGGSADLDGDTVVGSGDLAILLGTWGPCP